MDLDLGRQSIVEWAESAPDDAGSDFVPAKEKFNVEMPIGRGGRQRIDSSSAAATGSSSAASRTACSGETQTGT